MPAGGQSSSRRIIRWYPAACTESRCVGATRARFLQRWPAELCGPTRISREPAIRRSGPQLDSVFAADAPFIYASGHDHGLQVIQGHQPPEFLVSGAGTYHHLDRVEPIDGTRYEAHESGYMRLDFLRAHGIRLAVRVVDASAHAHDTYRQEWP